MTEKSRVNKQLLKGNNAVVHGALLGGATHFFGYPITPASEITHAAAKLFPLAGRHFLQAESEVSAINMLYGAAAAGARCMTASSGPGISLMAEGFSYLAGAELPCVVVNVQRAGPGLGNIWPEQSDYNAVCKGGGHGNYRNIVYAPSSAHEMYEFTFDAFEVADKYRTVVFILSDAYIGQIMEPVEFQAEVKHGKRKDWALYADAESRPNLISSLRMSLSDLSDLNFKLDRKYRDFAKELIAYEEVETDDAEYIFVAFGITARICFSAVRELRARGIKVGLVRPKILYPFPSEALRELSNKARTFIVAELNTGQMADDVQLAVGSTSTVQRYNWCGGIVPSLTELVERVEKDIKEEGL